MLEDDANESVRRDLLDYYEDEAQSQRRGPVSGYRVELRERFVELLLREGRRTVVDIGAGPASDAAGFVDASICYSGVDLSPANAALGSAAGYDVIAASLFNLPFADATFDAGWSMSTMMHVPEAEAAVAFREVVRPLRRGAPLAVGLWGGELGEIVSTHDSPHRRLFSLRTWSRNRALLEAVGEIEHHETWSPGLEGWEYHFAVVRIG